MELADLREQIGSEVESQTRRRISEEKTAPDGDVWEAWADDYAASRKSGRSLLEGEGDLLDSITFEVSGDAVLVGTNLVYGAIHQFGGEAVGINIPAREYLGVSEENEDDLLMLVDDWLDSQLEAIR